MRHLLPLFCGLLFCGLLIAAQPVAGQDKPSGDSKPLSDARSRMEEMRARMEAQEFTRQLSELGRSAALQKELEIDEVQAQEIRAGASAYSKKMMEFYNTHREDQLEMSKLRREGDRELAQSMMDAYYKKQAALGEELTAMADALLLPEQMKRLKQILKQQRAGRSNPFRDEFGMVLAIADELELTAEEKAEVTRVIQETRGEYYAKLDELKEKANNKILKSLSSEQRKRFKDLIGDFYDPEAQSRADNEERRKKYAEMRERTAKMLEESKKRAEAAKAEKEKSDLN